MRRQFGPVVPVEYVETNRDVPNVLDGLGAHLVRLVFELSGAAVGGFLVVGVGGHRGRGEDLVLYVFTALDGQEDHRPHERVSEEQHADAQIGGQTGEEGFFLGLRLRRGEAVAALAVVFGRFLVTVCVLVLVFSVVFQRVGVVFGYRWISLVAIVAGVFVHGVVATSHGLIRYLCRNVDRC